MKRIYILLPAFLFCAGLFAQLPPLGGAVSHAQWQFSSKKINACEYDLIFTLTLDPGWHTYSIHQVKGAEKEVKATEFKFKNPKDYVLVGAMSESKATPEYDKTIDKTVLLHYKKAVFTQRVKLTSNAKVKISGTYELALCMNGQCSFPPKDPFEFDLQGAGCSK